MKKNILNPRLFKKGSYLFFVVFIFLSLGNTNLFSQNGGTPADFEIDGGVYSGTVGVGTDDWFEGTSGFGLIDTSNSATYLTQTQNLVNEPFVVGSNFNQYEVVNGKVLYEAIFIRDYVNLNSIGGGLDQTTFGGGEKNGDNPETDWTFITTTVSEKNDIVDSYAHIRREGATIDTDMWIDLGVSCMSSAGDHFIDFEFFKSQIEVSGNGFINSGPDQGHTAWEFDASGNVISTGDLVIGFSYNSESINEVIARIWVQRTDFSNLNPTNFNWGTDFDGDWNGFGYAEIVIPAGLTIFDDLSGGGSGTTPAPPWGTYYDNTGSPFTTSYSDGNLAELAINLTDLGVDPSLAVGGDACEAPWTKIIVKSRSSSSFTAQLKDFSGPYDFLDPPVFDATIKEAGPFYCETELILEPLNPNGAAYYTWSTTDGEFLDGTMAASGNTATIVKPGVYTLSTSPFPGCAATSSTITILAGPCAIDDAGTITEDQGAFVYDVITNTDGTSDYDLSNDIVISTINNVGLLQPTNGTVSINTSTGEVTYTPNADFFGTDTFEYQICDATGLCDIALVTVTVEPEVDVVADVSTTPQEIPVTIAVSSNDNFEGVNNELTSATQPANGNVVINPDGTITYTPNTGFVGDDTFEYTVTVTNADGTTTTETATVTVTVTCAISIEEVSITNVACFGDATGNVDINVIGGTESFSFSWSNGATTEDLVNVPVGDYTVTVTDANDCIAEATYSVTQPAAALTAQIDSQVDILCGAESSVTVSAQGGTVQYNYSLDGGMPQASGTFTGLDAGNYVVTVTDGNACTFDVAVEILSNCTDAIDDINNTYINVAVDGNVLTNDEDAEGNTQVVTANTQPVNGSVVVNADGTYTYTPNMDFVGTDMFTYTICDNGIPQACDTANVVIEVSDIPVNDENNPPVANNDTATTDAGMPVAIVVLPNDFDPDGDTVTVTPGSVTDPTNGTAVLNADGTVTYTPDPGFTGEDTFTYQICDDGTPSLCDEATVTVTVNPENDVNETVANDDAYNGDQDGPITGNVSDNDSDPENDNQTVNTVPVIAPTNGTVVLNADGTFEYTPNPGYVGSDSFVYSVCDDGTPQACDEATVLLTVNPVNTTDAIDDINNTYINVAVDGNVLTNDEDAEGNTQVVTANTQPVNGSVVVNADGTYTYTPNMDFVGTDMFTYTICDNGIPQACDTANVVIEILPISGPDNEAPIANNDTSTTEEGAPVDIAILPNDFDPDGDMITVTPGSVTDPTNGTAVLNPDGTVTYTPDPGFTGEDTFTYQICDDGTPALCDEATVTITVDPMNVDDNDTYANDDAYTTTSESPINGSVLDNDTDPEGNNQIVNETPVVAPTNGTLVLNDDGTFVYTPNPGYVGTDSFVYSVCDDGLPQACDEATVYLTVGMELIPDFGPTIFSGNTTIIGATGVVDFRVFIAEYASQNSNGISPVELRIIKNEDLVITFNETLSTINGSPVKNTDWSYDASHPSLHKFTYVGNGGVFNANTASNIGINAVYSPPANTNGAFPLKVTIKYFSGGEINNTNNDDVDIIEYNNN